SLLQTVVKESNLADRIVKLKNSDDERDERSGLHGTSLDLSAAQPQQQHNGDGSNHVHQRRTERLNSHRLQIRPEKLFGGISKTHTLPCFHGERLHDAVARNRLVQNVLNVSKFVLSFTGSGAHSSADLSGRHDHERNEDDQNQRQLVSQPDHHTDHKNQGKKLLQKLSQGNGERRLNFLYIVDYG